MKLIPHYLALLLREFPTRPIFGFLLSTIARQSFNKHSQPSTTTVFLGLSLDTNAGSATSFVPSSLQGLQNHPAYDHGCYEEIS